jgi:hypothetical protein
MTGTVVAALLLLQVKHFIFDFVLQTPYQSRNKGIYGHPGGLLHAGLHVFGTAIVLAVLRVPVALLLGLLAAEFILHYHLDWGKEQVVKRFVFSRDTLFWLVFGLDQLLHQASYVMILFIVFEASL